MDEIRKAGIYDVCNSFEVGDVEFLLCENMKDPHGLYYMTCKVIDGGSFEHYDDVFSSNNYLEVAELYNCRINEKIQIQKQLNRKLYARFNREIFTEDKCEERNGQNLKNKIVVIDCETLRPEYRLQEVQIVRCLGIESNSIICQSFFEDKKESFEKNDILGILKEEHYPYWLRDILEREDNIKNNPYVFVYGNYHFLPAGVKTRSDNFDTMSRYIVTDEDFDICSRDSKRVSDKNKTKFNRKDFYDACNNLPCDIFRCLENGRYYIPGEKELFRYYGRFRKYTPPKRKAKRKKEVER